MAHALDSLEALPAVSSTLDAIVASRRRARPGYSPSAMFRAFCLKYLLGKRYTVALIERLRSSPRPREICGFADALPFESSFSRFFSRMASADDSTDQAIAEMVERLKERLPDLGADVAVDSTDIEAYANLSEVRDGGGPWGRRTTKSRAETEPFFGFKVHAISDAVHGVPLAQITLTANKNDSPQLVALVDKALGLFPWLKPKHLLADRSYDSQANHKRLVERGIKPIIYVRKPTASDRLHDGLYDKRGRPVCADGRTPMEYLTTDPNTGFHKFRCPSGGCALKAKSSGAVRYCDTTELWVDPADNYRAGGVVYRDSPEWKRLYSRRQIIERLFGSLKQSRLLNRH